MDITIITLIEKITRAKVVLKSIDAEHHRSCPEWHDDLDSYAQCTCGAKKINSAVRKALQVLDVEK